MKMNKTKLVDTRLFDVLVGYFRSSGFYQLYDSIEPPWKTSQTIKKAFEKNFDPLEMLGILRQHIRMVDAADGQPARHAGSRREIILSGYQLAPKSTE